MLELTLNQPSPASTAAPPRNILLQQCLRWGSIVAGEDTYVKQAGGWQRFMYRADWGWRNSCVSVVKGLVFLCGGGGGCQQVASGLCVNRQRRELHSVCIQAATFVNDT